MVDIAGFRVFGWGFVAWVRDVLQVTLYMTLKVTFLMPLHLLQTFHSLYRSPMRHTGGEVGLEHGLWLEQGGGRGCRDVWAGVEQRGYGSAAGGLSLIHI